MARVGIFLTAVALIAGMVGCGGGPYDLTIASTAGGTVTTPGEGVFTCEGGTVVNLVAEASDDYQFVNWIGDVDTIADVYDAETTITMNDNYSITANFGSYTPMIAAGSHHTVGLMADGTVVALGLNLFEQCNVDGWRDVTQVAAGDWHTVGLKCDGRVATVGDNSYGQCDVSDWTDIVQVDAGYAHTAGVKTDGTVVAVGLNEMDSAMSAAGRTSPRSPQETITRWDLRMTAPWSPWDRITTVSAMLAT